MSRAAFRFAVGTPDSTRSAVWRAWQTGDDVYVATRTLGGVYKASLHRGGDCYAGFTSAYAPKARASGALPAGRSRQTLTWVGRPINDALTLLLRILVPESELAVIGDPKLGTKSAHWLPRPPEVNGLEISFFLGQPGLVFPHWPGAKSMRTELLDRFLLPSGSFVYAVWRHTDEMAYAHEQLLEFRKRLVRDEPSWLTPQLMRNHQGIRMIVVGQDKDYRVGFLLEAGLGDLNRVAA
jgi:hypothetical protein